MQTDKLSLPKLFYASSIDIKDEIEEKFEKARGVLRRLVGQGSEREIHDALQSAVCRDKGTHDEISLGLLSNILTDSTSAPNAFRDLIMVNRDNMNVVVDILAQIALEKYLKLTDVSRAQLLWMVKELVRAGVAGADVICWNLMRQIAGGDISNRNLWLAENMLELYVEFRGWLEKFPLLLASVIFTYLRILEDHFPQHLAYFRAKEVNFVVSLIRENFQSVCMNPLHCMGRDFIRLLQGVSRIPEIQALWTDIMYNPKTLSPHLTGLDHFLSVRTSRRFLQSRLTPEMERKIVFLTSSVKFGMHKRYQEWFQRQFLSTPESQTLRADIIRFIVGVIHPSNDVLCSDILPRWAIIGWLLTTCTNPVAYATAKLALFFDWLLFDPTKDNIMNIEPGILVMYHSIRPHLAITATLLDFLIRLIKEFWPGSSDKIKEGVGAAFRTILEKKVLPSLEPVLENTKLEPELRNSIADVLLPLVKKDVMPEPPVLTISNNGHASIGSTSEVVENMNLNYSPETNHLTTKGDTFTHLDPTFSDDEDEEESNEDQSEHLLGIKPMLTGTVPSRSSPTLGTSVEEAERSKIFDLVQTLPPNIRMPLDKMLGGCSDKEDFVEDILEECTFQMEKDQREALVKALVYVFKQEILPPLVDEETGSLKDFSPITPISEIIDKLLDLKPSDKTIKSKNLYRILSDIIFAVPAVGYKVIILLGYFDDPEEKKSANCSSVYKNLCSYRNMKLEQMLYHDVKTCWEIEPLAVSHLCPLIYDWYSECTGNAEILKLVVSTIDSTQLQDIVWSVAQGDFQMMEPADMNTLISKSLEWETWEQHCVWTIMSAHGFEIDDYLPVIPMLDYKNNAEALTALFLRLKDQKPVEKIVAPCLCRKPNPKDKFVISLLMSWSDVDKEKTSETLTQVLVRACGSPMKRKRGMTSGGRGGTSSPAGPLTPTVENVLGHLDLLREQIDVSGIFTTDTMQAALLQLRMSDTWVSDTLRNKYKDLLAMCALEEESDTKEQRSRRTATARKLPSSPTGSAVSNSSTSENKSSSLSRTRSGKTRQVVKDGSDSSSGDDDDEPIPRPRSAKKRRKTSALNSDSD